MRFAAVLAVVGTVLAAGAVGFTVGWFAAGSGHASGPAASSASPAEAAPASPPRTPDTLAELRAENAGLRMQLNEISRERERLSKDYLQLVLQSALHGEPASGAGAAPDEVRVIWEEGMASLSGATGGAMGKLEESIALLADMARFGKAGIAFLGRIANDRTAGDQERETALQILSYLRDPAALDVLMGFRDPSILELDFPYDLVRGHVGGLPTQQIRQHIPALVQQLQSDLGADNFSPERPEVALLLATEHNSPEARRLLFDERMWRDNVQGALRLAEARHDSLSRQFVEATARNHNEQRYRELAADILETW